MSDTGRASILSELSTRLSGDAEGPCGGGPPRAGFPDAGMRRARNAGRWPLGERGGGREGGPQAEPPRWRAGHAEAVGGSGPDGPRVVHRKESACTERRNQLGPARPRPDAACCREPSPLTFHLPRGAAAVSSPPRQAS